MIRVDSGTVLKQYFVLSRHSLRHAFSFVSSLSSFVLAASFTRSSGNTTINRYYFATEGMWADNIHQIESARKRLCLILCVMENEVFSSSAR